MGIKKIRLRTLIIAAVASILVFMAIISYRAQIRTHAVLVQAHRFYKGDHVAVLLAYLGAPEYSPMQKTRAVFMLGSLRDTRAMPALMQLHTGTGCDHKKYVCQREVEKAMDKITGSRPGPSKLFRAATSLWTPKLYVADKSGK